MIRIFAAQPGCIASLRLYVCAADDYKAFSGGHNRHRALLNMPMLMADSAHCPVQYGASKVKPHRVHVNVNLTSFAITVWGLHGVALHGLPQRGDG